MRFNFAVAAAAMLALFTAPTLPSASAAAGSAISAAVPDASTPSSSKKVKLLGSEQKLVDRKMKVTADIRVAASVNVTLLAIGYDSTNRIIEIQKEDKYMYSGQTATLQVTMNSGSRIKRVEVQALEPIDSSYQVLSTATIAHKDNYEAVIAVKNGNKAQAINAIAKGMDSQGRVVEISGESVYAYEQRTAILSIRLKAIKEIDHVQILAVADDETYFIDQGIHMSNGTPIYTAVIKNGKQAQRIQGKITPYRKDGSKLPAVTVSENVNANRLYTVRVPLQQNGAVKAAGSFSAGAKKQEIAPRGITIVVDGNKLAVSQPPIAISNTIYVPMRAIFEALGAKVEYKPEVSKVVASKSNHQVTLHFASGTAAIKTNNKVTIVPVKPFFIRNTTMIPLRFISEALGAEVSWQPKLQTVSIYNTN